MEVLNLILIFFLLFCPLLSGPSILMSHSQPLPIVDDQGDDPSRIQTYIVHVAKPEGAVFLGHEDLKRWHLSFLPNTTLDSGEPRLVYSYRHAISGFAARLTAEEVRAMKAMDGFLLAMPNEMHKLLTTYTPEFLGLSEMDGAWTNTLLGEGIIIGVLDSGALPTHPSFKDYGMPPHPIKWNGTCYTGFACNNKIIGALGFHNGNTTSPMDTDGHGTHVASTAAGSPVAHTSVLGMARGSTASGMAPKAHLAIYKVCFPICRHNSTCCMEDDVLAGIDQAISDRVDVISMSISGYPTGKYNKDPIAQGSLAAVEKGISAVAAAGNDGPGSHNLNHDAPWVLTVGASSTDRRVGAFVKLGNGKVLEGESAYQPSTFNSSKLFPMVYPGVYGDPSATYCKKGSLDYIDVRDKVVLCETGLVDNVEMGKVVDAAGGAAMIIMNQPGEGRATTSAAHVLPVSHLSYPNGRRVLNYFLSSTNTTPTATIVFNGTSFGHRPSPAVACFSSRGPSRRNGGILKPDVLAPGVNILATWPFDVGPNPSWSATKTFNFDSGTSMATPHVSGIIALMKNKYPQWSAAAIESAIVTSAVDQDLDGNFIFDEVFNDIANIYSRGAGQVNASGAMDPGLVYDLNPSDYIGYLCGLAYTDAEVTATARRRVQCSSVQSISPSQLNYPSIQGSLGSLSPSQSFVRTVTNVGEPNSVYWANITEPVGVTVDLSSYRLQFSRLGEQETFTVTLGISSSGPGNRLVSRGKLQWVSDKHVVTSPIAVTFI